VKIYIGDYMKIHKFNTGILDVNNNKTTKLKPPKYNREIGQIEYG
jgi:hypothetical protein